MIVPAEGTFRLDREADTARLGAAMGRELQRHEAICLSGPLGAGKSTLARGLIRALAGADVEAPSPTFTLVQTYATHAFPVAHFDLYRLESPDEAFELGFDEALDDGAARKSAFTASRSELKRSRLPRAMRGEPRAPPLAVER